MNLSNLNNQKLITILDYLNISFFMISMDSIFLDVNETFLKMTGAKREDLIGKDIRTKIPQKDLDRFEAELQHSGFEKDVLQFEGYAYHVDRKKKYPCLYHISLNRDESQSPVSVNVLAIDIEKQKKNQEELEKEKKLLEAILFGIRDCVAVFDEAGEYMFANQKSLEVRGGQKHMLLPMNNKGSLQLSITVEKKTCQFEAEVRKIYDNKGKLFAYAETLTDITSNKKLEENEKELFLMRRKIKLDSLKTEMVGSSQAMLPVFETILRCAEVTSSILISGETGVGKELAARAIHEQSDRKGKSFVAVNCSAIPENLLESELFGHMKGSFTGAIKDRPGLFREANGGTIFLDEIGELKNSLQVKLLRAIQEKEVKPVGSDQSFKVDVRIISATNRNLPEQVEQENFRSDLFYRIAVIQLRIPSLRERSDDILFLSRHFLKKMQKGKQRQQRLDESCIRILFEYNWPGNIRELENAIEHCLAMTSNRIISSNFLPPTLLKNPISKDEGSLNWSEPTLNSIKSQQKDYERQSITDALIKHNGNQTKAAKELGISRVTLWRKKTMYNT